MTSPLVSVVKAKLRAEGHFVLTLRGRCMEPLLFAGDRVRVEACEDPSVGDLCLVILPDGALALHRVVSVSGGATACKGDYSGKAESLGPGCVIGRAVSFMPDGLGVWVRWSQGDAYRREIVSLSRVLSDRGAARDIRQEARRRVWELNEGKRAELLACMYPPVG